MQNEAPPQTGIELIEGVPGAGKSFVAVKRLVDVIQQSRRPVYTNLPMKWRVFRTFLRKRGGEQLAALVHQLTEEHFRAFIERYEKQRKFKEGLRASSPGMSRREQRDRWIEHAGPDRTGPVLNQERGIVEHGNWIPAGALIIIDEAHHWFRNPALKGMANTTPEPGALLSYLTMHRHLLHWVWFITQDRRQISTTIKSLIRYLWVVRNRSEDKVAWGVRFKHLGLKNVLGYEQWQPEFENDRERGLLQHFTYFPRLPWHQWVFRLYESFTHAGSARELRTGLREARLEAGLSEDGSIEEIVMEKKELSRGARLVRWTGRKVALVLMIVAAAAIGHDKGAREAAASAPVVEAVPPVVVPPVPIVKHDRSVVLRSFSKDSVRFASGERIGLAGEFRGLELLHVDAKKRWSVWIDRAADEVWLWGSGRGAQKLGPTAAVTRAFDAGFFEQSAGRPARAPAPPANPDEPRGAMGAGSDCIGCDFLRK